MTAASRESLVSQVFVELADTLVKGYDLVEMLHTLTERGVELLDASAAGLVLRDPRGGLETIASTSEASELLELLQLRTGQGPCTEAYTSGVAVDMEDISPVAAHDPRWPQFQAGAYEYGFRSVHAVPMRLRQETVGAFNLFRDRPGALPPEDVLLAQALADMATISILQQRNLRQSTELGAQLRQALDSRVVIEQAKGVLAQQGAPDMHAAFQVLRRHARHHGQGLRDVALAVVERRLDLAVLTASAGS
ncbi:GAF and ANTAR domain-containing protein [Kineococcus sp. NUM-3379]